MKNLQVNDYSTDIAIIGMSGRFPGARNIDQFWRNLRDGVESITFFSDEELTANGVRPSTLKDPSYVKAKGVLEDSELFDSSFFGFSPRNAEVTDPQHRVFLECAWEALEDAGYEPGAYQGSIGVYAGLNSSTYLYNILSNPDASKSVDLFQTAIGNEKDHLPTLVSYKLNLRGPSMAIQTSCSTSLVAVCSACQSLLFQKCDIAIAGGVSISVPTRAGYRYVDGGVMSPDGHCRAFDAAAKGTVGGNGVGIVVLKRLQDALEDGDHIYAVIKGSAVNNDGSSKVGYTAPSIEGQAEVIAEALALAGLEPGSIGYIEAHGTGTPLGDPIEIAALKQVFQDACPPKSCAIGSVKTAIGHLDAAAGIAGLIKAVLTVKHGLIPPSLHFQTPNPESDFDNSPFYVNTALSEWKRSQSPRRAGVSSFGIGGTNAHVIIEEPPALGPSGPSRREKLIVLSAKTSGALDKLTENLAHHIEKNPHLDLADAAYTLQVGRQAFDHRRAVVASDAQQAITLLKNPQRDRVFDGRERERPAVAFMFPGQGAQYVHMGSALYRQEKHFREYVDRCADLLKPELGIDLREALYSSGDLKKDADLTLNRTEFAQPALFTIEYALAMQLIEWGVYPAATIGHSLGEYVAATIAGVMPLERALKLVARRARLMGRLEAGAMLAVSLGEKEARRFLDGKLSLAAVNSPSACVISGPVNAIDDLQGKLRQMRVASRKLDAAHAFHSYAVDPALEALIDEIKGIELSAPLISYISNVTGTWIRDDQAKDPSYWSMQSRETVRFSDGIRELMNQEGMMLLEVGPGRTLGRLARQQVGRKDGVIIPTMESAENAETDHDLSATALARLWTEGVSVNWAKYNSPNKRRLTALPPYPFERQRYWIEPGSALITSRADKHRVKKSMNEWFYAPSWKRRAIEPNIRQDRRNENKPIWVVFSDELKIGEKLVNRLSQSGEEVIHVQSGRASATAGASGFRIDPTSREDYRLLAKSLKKSGGRPTRVLHLWGATALDEVESRDEKFNRAQYKGYYSLLYLAQAIAAENITDDVEVILVINGVSEVTGTEKLIPEKSTILGPCRVIPQEYPNIRCRCIDIEDLGEDGWQEQSLMEEMTSRYEDEWNYQVAAYRGKSRWVETFEPIRTGVSDEGQGPLDAGVFLITGGLGALGQEIARYLVGKGANVVLTSRKGLTSAEQWDQWIKDNGYKPRSIDRNGDILELESGARIMALKADVTDQAQMREVIRKTKKNFGRITGVIHAVGQTRENTYYAVPETGPRESQSQFDPKTRGAYILDELLDSEDAQFCLLMSSLSSTLGGLGFAAYSAANNFLDAFARKLRRTAKCKWISVNLDGWDVAETGQSGVSETAALSIRGEEGCRALERILTLESEGQILVSVTDLDSRVSEWVRFEGLRATGSKSSEKDSSLSLYARLAVKSEYTAPGREVELRVLKIWENLLGIADIGVEDNYFELGGDSLLAVQLISRLREEFGVEIPLRSVFEQPTIRALALIIEATLINQLETLTEDQAELILDGEAW